MLKAGNFSIDCNQGDYWIVTDDASMGPFCNEKGRKRRSYPASKNTAYGKNYKTEEMDLVFRNGQSLKFKFGFQFELDFNPGYLGDDGMCPYREITSSNAYFKNAVTGYKGYDYNGKYASKNAYAIQMWGELTQSLYDFNINYDYYRNQCQSYSPVHISCDALEWEGRSWKQLLVQIKALINAQCRLGFSKHNIRIYIIRIFNFSQIFTNINRYNRISEVAYTFFT